jgi:hypothetical protein
MREINFTEYFFCRTTRMSYRRRESKNARLAERLSKTHRLASVSSIRFVGRLFRHHLCLSHFAADVVRDAR